MCTLDERTTEYVTDDSLASSALMTTAIQFDATRYRIREQCGIRTGAGPIGLISDDPQLFEVTREGQRYLADDLNTEHQPRPNLRAGG